MGCPKITFSPLKNPFLSFTPSLGNLTIPAQEEAGPAGSGFLWPAECVGGQPGGSEEPRFTSVYRTTAEGHQGVRAPPITENCSWGEEGGSISHP